MSKKKITELLINILLVITTVFIFILILGILYKLYMYYDIISQIKTKIKTLQTLEIQLNNKVEITNKEKENLGFKVFTSVSKFLFKYFFL